MIARQAVQNLFKEDERTEEWKVMFGKRAWYSKLFTKERGGGEGNRRKYEMSMENR